jgi:prephenate dehydrogenase
VQHWRAFQAENALRGAPVLDLSQGLPARIAIVGVGLIGGSFALGLRRAHPEIRVIGIDRDEANLDLAIRRGVIDEAGTLDVIADADVVLLAVPVLQMDALFGEIATRLRPGAILTDVGSTKQRVISSARAGLGANIANFVPAHPIAGREHSGVAAAASELFEGKHVVLTPMAENPPAALALVSRLWKACGACVAEMPAEAHDAVFAAVSHLPHMLAFTLVDELAARANAKQLFAFAASGFRDFTRIASSSPEMWRDIALHNRDAVVVEFDRYLTHARQLRDAIAAGDGAAIEALMQRAQIARDRWLAGELEYFRDEAS